MNPNQRFSILTFPQLFDGTDLELNIVILPRDQNPLSAAIEQHPTIADAPAFADAQLRFTAGIFDTLAVFPHSLPPVAGLPLAVTAPDDPRRIFQALAGHLSITNLTGTNRNIDLAALEGPTPARPEELTVKKYLPRSYRRAFNFTTPRHANAVTDDSYHCAVKDGKKVPGFTRSPNTVSWGKVFAHLMRQPLLAARAGLIYHTRLTVDAGHFPDGGWLFVDLAPDSDYRAQLDTDAAFTRRYAARIPRLTPGEPRHVFAPLQFPVLPKAQAADPDPTPAGNYDNLFIEAAAYDDGFARIVHCHQPPNRDLLLEENDGAHPVKDVGIRLGWEDEQILVWYIRQMRADPAGELSGRLDAPLGVFGYRIDVRETAEPENPWESLNAVESRQPLSLSDPAAPGDPIVLGAFAGALPYQVYPMQVDGRKQLNYWLPMYFANWTGHSMVLPDDDAAAIYRTTHVDVLADPEDPVNDTGTGVSGPAQNQLSQIYRPEPIDTRLRYGRNYEFRVRFQDLSGGAPAIDRTPLDATPSDIGRCRFRRFLSPNQPRIVEMQASGGDDSPLVNVDAPARLTQLNVQRPKLNYPAVVYTGKYDDPIQRLVDQAGLGLQVDSQDLQAGAEHRVGLGIADPDVDRLEITVEVATLKLDKLDSVSGREDYVHLYTTTRPFPAVDSDDDYEAVLNLPIEYRDVHVLHTGTQTDLIDDLDLPADIDTLTQLVLPTGRTLRLTLRAVCEEKSDNAAYYGFIDDSDKRLDNRYGEPFQVMLGAPSADETALLVETPGVPPLQGIYLQPDHVLAHDGRAISLLLGKKTAGGQHSNVQLLADRLDLVSNGLTLTGAKGERVVFGCSSRIRHTLSPDHSSITFAAKGDLASHWLCCISYAVDRDWMWDALENRSFTIRRSKRFTRQAQSATEQAVVGDIEMLRTASFEALHQPQRNSTRIVFIDAVEPKPAAPAGGEPDFPDTIELTYAVEPLFKADHGGQHDAPDSRALSLPITTPPAQVPKIVSAGIALTPYRRNAEYSSTQPRRRHLWIEFAEPVKDPRDTVFARMLAVAPDQLLSNNHPDLLVAPEEPGLPIDPEIIRTITPGATNDLAGLSAMQPMEKSTSSDRHYLLPLPPGLHADAEELFGFFTYEFRVGHYRDPDSQEMVWTTGQGRYGRRLRATGIQHPAPTLTCMPNRDVDKLWVTAPHAVAVHAGRNVTADPPRTQLWALLYAQVRQADNRDFRNILLDDRQLDWRVQVETERNTNLLGRYSDEQLQVLKTIATRNFKYEIQAASLINTLKLVDVSTRNRDATRYATAVWTNNEVIQLLDRLGLPLDAPLSVLVIETLPQVRSIFEHVSGIDRPGVAQAAGAVAGGGSRGFVRRMAERAGQAKVAARETASPVSDELGHHRLLRTSPLTEVPAVCPPA